MNKIIAAIAATACVASSAAAQDLDGYTLGLQYQRYDDGDGFTVDTMELNGDVAVTFGSYGAQLGLAYAEEVDSSDPFLDFRHTSAATLHLFYDVNDQWRLGVMTGHDGFDDADYVLALEGIYLNGPIRIEGRIGTYVSNDGPDIDLYGIYGSYDLNDRIDLRGFYRYADYGPFGSYEVTSLGVGFDLTETWHAYVDYGLHTNDFGGGDVYDGTLVSVGIEYRFGQQNDRLFTYTPFY